MSEPPEGPAGDVRRLTDIRQRLDRGREYDDAADEIDAWRRVYIADVATLLDALAAEQEAHAETRRSRDNFRAEADARLDANKAMHAKLDTAEAARDQALAERDGLAKALAEIAEDVGVLSNDYIRATAAAALTPSTPPNTAEGE